MNSKNEQTAKSASEKRLKFPPWRRLRSKFDFAAIYDHRQKAGDRWMLVFARRNGLGYTRIGLSVSRKHGNSVVRHRLRRLLKEAYRLEQHSIPEGLDMILIPGHQALGATLSDFRDSLVRLSRKLTNRLPHRQL